MSKHPAHRPEVEGRPSALRTALDAALYLALGSAGALTLLQGVAAAPAAQAPQTDGNEPYPFERALGVTEAGTRAEAQASQGAQAAARTDARTTAASAVLVPEAHASTGAFTPLTVTLLPDEKACRALWGDDWYAKCRRSIGRAGSRVEGIRMTPALPGVWRAQGSSLVFTPEKPWRPNETVRVDLSGLVLPSGVRLTAREATATLPPLALVSDESALLIDPDPKGKRFATFAGTLTTAIDRADFERRFAIERVAGNPKAAKADLPELGRPLFIWEKDAPDAFYVRIPILKLGRDPAELRATIPGAAASVRSDGSGGWLTTAGTDASGNAQLALGLPGESTLFQVTGVSISSSRDENLNDLYEVLVTTSMNVTTEALVRALEVKLLPEKLNDDAASTTNWSAAPALDDNVLKRSTPLKVVSADAADAPAVEHRIRFTAPAGRYAVLRLPEGFAAPGTAGLRTAWTAAVALPDPGSRLDFLQPGHVLALSGTKTLTFAASAVDEVDYRIVRVRDAFLASAADMPRALTNPATSDTAVDARTGTIALGAKGSADAARETRFGAIDFAPFLAEEGPGLYRVTLTGFVTEKDGKRRARTTTERSVLITNTGLVVKENADRSIDLFALELDTGAPASERTALLLAANGTVLQRSTTDATGRARFDSTAGLEREKRPSAILLKREADGKTTDLAWISLSDFENLSNLSRFETAGRASSENLAALAFADRGLYRAGETVRFAAVVASTDGKALPEGLPLKLRVTDGRGRLLAERALRAGEDGLVNFDWTIPKDFVSGSVRCDVTVGDGRILSTARVAVEDFAPETLRLTVDTGTLPAGWVPLENREALLTLLQRTGSAAEGRTVSGTLFATNAGVITFPGWEDFDFLDPIPAPVVAYREFPIAPVDTDRTGAARATLPLGELTPATYRANVHWEGFELEGGRAVTEESAFLVSPARLMAGWRLVETSRTTDWLAQNAPVAMEIALVDPNLKPAAGMTLTARFSKRRSVTELAEDASGRVTIRDAYATVPAGETQAATGPEGRVVVKLPTAEAGDFLVELATADGTELGRIPYHVAADSLEAATEELQTAEVKAVLEKTSVRAGERVKLSVLSPYRGKALLTLEGAKVEDALWADVEAGDNTIEWTVPEGVAPGRHYLHAAVMKTAANVSSKASPSDARLLKGYTETVLPVSIDRDLRTAKVTITTPERTDSPRSIPVTVASDRPAKVFLWAVDEGVLALTNYAAPDPARAVLDDRALGVETRQLIEHLMPDAPALPSTLSAFGGDFEARAALGAMTNPFRRTGVETAVWWGGLVETGPEGKTFKMTLPERFNGRVRVFAVGTAEPLEAKPEAKSDAKSAVKSEKASDDAGRALVAASAAATVAPPLALEPVLPAALSPGDTFRGAVLVTRNADPKGGKTPTTEEPAQETVEASVTIDAPDFAPQPASGTVTLRTGATETFAGTFTAPSEPGLFTLRANARAADLRASADETISVRPATLFETTRSGGRLGGKNTDAKPSAPTDVASARLDAKGAEIAWPGALYPIEADTRLSVSRLPVPLLSGCLSASAPAYWGTLNERLAAAAPLLLLDETLWRAADGPATAGANEGGRPTPRPAANENTDATTDDKLPTFAEERATRLAALRSSIREHLGARGLSPYPGGEPDAATSAEALMTMLDARRVDPSVDEEIPALRRSLETTLNDLPETLEEARDRAYGLWVLTREGTLVADRLESLRRTVTERFEGAPGDALWVYLAGAADLMRMKDAARTLLPAEIDPNARTTDLARMTTVLAEAAARPDSALSGQANAAKLKTLTARLTETALDALSRDDLRPLDAALTVRALMRSGTLGEASNDRSADPAPVCTKWAEGFEPRAETHRTPYGVTVTAPGCLNFRIDATEAGSLDGLYWSAIRSGFARDAAPAPVREGFEIERRYLNAAGEEAKEFALGELVTVEVRLRGYGGARFDVRDALRQIAVTDLLPGGFTLADAPGTPVEVVTGEEAISTERAEDRIRFLLERVTSEESIYAYRVRATTPGTFRTAPAAAESLLSRAVRARGTSGTVTVREDKAR